ncbi:MAG: 3-dehydroquinate synthase [Raineya sp.]
MKNIFFCHNAIAEEWQNFLQINDYTQIVWLVDTHTKTYCLPLLDAVSSSDLVIEIPAGEIHKNLQTCQTIWQALTQANIDRKALLVNVGGGVIGDMGGFCAATYKRGIDFIQIPTTLLAQVDASVGGKLGIDFENFKNQIGVFALPKAVFIDTQFLETLPENQLRSGFAEIIKHCLIADKDMWNRLLETPRWQDQNWQEMVEHSVEIKYEIVSKDFEEKNIRKLLNFGHTIGHAIETYFLDTKTPLLHGEAVAWGMVAESFISYKKSYLGKIDYEEIKTYIERIFNPKPALNDVVIEKITELTAQDKKNQEGKRLFTLLNEIGTGIFGIEVDEYEIYEALQEI